MICILPLASLDHRAFMFTLFSVMPDTNLVLSMCYFLFPYDVIKLIKFYSFVSSVQLSQFRHF